MERTSIITSLFVSNIINYPSLTLSPYPIAQNLQDYFIKIPIVLERAEIKESSEDTDQGNLLDIAIRSNVHRESIIPALLAKKLLMVYLETANGEKHFFGTPDNPLIFEFTKNSGATNDDNRETTLLFGQKVAL
jgi:hypothetical protein